MITNPFENRKKKEPVDIRKIFGLGSPLSMPTAGAKMSTSSSVQKREPFTMITNPFENRKKQESVDIRKIFGLGSPLSTPTARVKMSTSPSVQEREPFTGLSGKSFSVRDLLSGLEKESVDIRKIFGLDSPLSAPTARAKISTEMITNPFENIEKEEPVDIRKIFGLDSPLSTDSKSFKGFVPRSTESLPKEVSSPSSLGSQEDMLKALSVLQNSGQPGVVQNTSFKQSFNPQFANEFKAKTGVPFGGAKNSGPLGLTTPGILEGVVKNDEMPYDNQPRVLFPDEVNSVEQQQQQQQQQQQTTPIQQTQQTAAVDPEQQRTERINQLINLGKAMGGNPDIDEMIMTAILNEYMTEPESLADKLALAYQTTQDPLIGEAFAKSLYSELGIDPVEKQKQDLYMQEFMKDFTENADTADIYAAVRRNPNLVEQYYNALDREGKGFLGLNNTEKKREERMRRLMGTGSTVTQ